MNRKESNILIIFLIASLLTACVDKQSAYPEWKIIYKNDKKGSALLGSKQDLINQIRLGAPIRIGWGAKGKNHSIEHISVPIWLAILDEKEVIAHLDPQVLSTVDWDNLSANYADSTKLSEEWRVVLTTKGEFDAVWYDRNGNELLRRRPQYHMISWFVQTSSDEVKGSPFFEQEKVLLLFRL